jgi:hypothetical protein
VLTENEVLERAFRALDALVAPVARPATMAPKAAEVKPETASCAEPPRLEAAPVEASSPELSLKGRAVELWRDGHRFFIVADEEDVQEAMRRFSARRGEVWTPAEIELVGRIVDQHVRDEIAGFKRQFDGSLSPDTLPRPARETRTWRGR